MKKSDIAFARSEMFREAAEHLELEVTNDPDEIKQIPYVKKIIEGYADRWLNKYHDLRKKENHES